MGSENAEESFTAKAEATFFGRQRRADEPFGVHRRLVVAQTTNPEIARVGQDGGVATTLLSFALENGVIDAALVTGTHPDKPFYPLPKLATTTAEILAAAGSKYTCSQTPLTLAPEAAKQGKTRVAFVGMPCQIRALRRIQISESSKISFVKLSLGLMCSGCFRHKLISDFIQKKLGIDPHRIVKLNIKQKLLITTDTGVTAVPLSEIAPHKQKGCDICHDFSSELADISIGGLGLEDWSFVVVRSEKGEELLHAAENNGFLRTKTVEKDSRGLNLLTKLSKKKRENV
jgi:coenzyme F420 hydrogenase subunit beta